MSFSSTLLHARKSRANSEISELLTARRMDITVWMSSPNDVVPAVAEAGATRVARGGQLLQTVPGGPRWQRGLWFTPRVGDGLRRQPGLLAVCCWRQFTQEGFSPDSRVRGHLWSNVGPTFHAARVRMTVGGRVATTGSGGTALDLLCVGPLLGYPRGHTMFRLLNIFLASSVLGRTARTSHNGEPSLGKVCAPSAQGSPGRRGRFGFRLPGSRLGGAVGLAPVPGAVLAVTACVEAETGFRLTQPGGTRSLSLLDREGFASFARDVGADDGSMSISGWSRATFAF
ncbi:hypothetical protein EVAR_74675_1 [Eumeta japonica]|uniref:Uncharacterized protein n=1 Tax=Eumeta variegata TaxID=151549 RepID=A0A4C1TH61_EUMVA|nr:hypothetical protein EVAR_74675_1 [Eumeta japonica]